MARGSRTMTVISGDFTCLAVLVGSQIYTETTQLAVGHSHHNGPGWSAVGACRVVGESLGWFVSRSGGQ